MLWMLNSLFLPLSLSIELSAISPWWSLLIPRRFFLICMLCLSLDVCSEWMFGVIKNRTTSWDRSDNQLRRAISIFRKNVLYSISIKRSGGWLRRRDGRWFWTGSRTFCFLFWSTILKRTRNCFITKLTSCLSSKERGWRSVCRESWRRSLNRRRGWTFLYRCLCCVEDEEWFIIWLRLIQLCWLVKAMFVISPWDS